MTLPSSVCSLVAALAVVFLALSASRHVRSDDHFVSGCDRYGYECMAHTIRQAREAGKSPDHFFRDEQTRWLVAQFKASGLPLNEWDDVVANLAHHYFPGTDQVGPQYPPGTGWMLSLFPADDDVRALDRLTIWLVVAGTLVLLAWSAWRGLTLTSLLLAGAAAALLAPYGWTEGESYSISASTGPLFFGAVLAWLATRARDWRVAVACGVGAGLCFGLLIQIRIASVLLAPAPALLFVPRQRRFVLPGYALGVVLAGIVPVLLHNQAIAGGLFSATYNRDDRAQALGSVAANLRFYFVRYVYNSGFLHLAAIAAAILVWLVVVAVTRPRGAVFGWRAWLADHAAWVAAPVCAAGISLAYFLTHVVTVYYYLTPAILLTCLLLALLGIALEEHWQKVTGYFMDANKPPLLAAGVAVAAALLTLTFAHRPLYHLARSGLDGHEQPTPPFDVPPALLDPRAWIWADELSGTIRHYTGHPAFKTPFSRPGTRQLLYGWVHAKGDPQYLVADSHYTRDLVEEARAGGWQLTPIGETREAVCYRMEAR